MKSINRDLIMFMDEIEDYMINGNDEYCKYMFIHKKDYEKIKQKYLK